MRIRSVRCRSVPTFVGHACWMALLLSTGRFSSADEPAQVPVTRLIVHPAAEPTPALRYRLLPPFIDLAPGNAALVYTKICVEFATQQSAEAHERQEKIAGWLDLPIDQLPRAEVAQLLAAEDYRLDEADRGARMESCDWQLPIRGEEPWMVRLPEAQGMRNVARLVALRTRLLIVDRKYDEAIRSLQTGFAMARHIGQQPTIVSGLVGLAISSLMFHELDNLVQASDAPNLYWALMALPRPLVDMRVGIEQEQYWIDYGFPNLRGIAAANFTPDQWREQLLKVARTSASLLSLSDTPTVAPDVVATLFSIKTYTRAKQTLIAAGKTPAEVEAMPVAQVVLLVTLTDYERLRDENFKWSYVPFAQRGNGPRQANEKTQAAAREFVGYPFVALLGAVENASWAEVKSQRTLAAHIVVEAIRMHAATYGGRLPDRLNEITVVPVPVDPSTDQPFGYALRDNQALITSAAPPGFAAEHAALRFEVSLAKP